MPIQLISLNGKHRLVDYESLEEGFKEFLGNNCNEATIYVYNNFNAPVCSELNIDLLILFCLGNAHGNYCRVRDCGNELVYYRNAIIPITVTNQFLKSEILIEDKYLLIDGCEYDNQDERNSLKYGLKTFLVETGSFPQYVNTEVIELVINENHSLTEGNTLIGKNFDVKSFFSILKNYPQNFCCSYKPWTEKKLGYELFKTHAQAINEVAAKYSKFGYLTKRKMERVAKQLSNVSALYDSIGFQPTLIVGKAGTGKTAHLLHLLMRSISKNRNVTFLTYNHLLTKDVAYQVKVTKAYLQKEFLEEGETEFASATVQTLMSFMFRLSKSLGVLHLMTEDRFAELHQILKTSLRFLVDNLPGTFDNHSNRIFGIHTNYNVAIEVIQNSTWQITTKEYGVSFVRFLRANNRSLTVDLSRSAKEFYGIKLGQLQDMTQHNIFLRDYVGCLRNTLNIIQDPKGFYDEFDVGNKYELLETLMNLRDRKQDEEARNYRISEVTFTKRIKNVIKGRLTKSRLLFIDEGQDCHPYEREIFYEMFGPANVVASFGGKEQLIRFANACNWDIFRSKPIKIKKIPSGNKSFRVKKNILELCNYIAVLHNIDLQLKCFSEEDPGELILDLRTTPTTFDFFPILLGKGAVNGCEPLEALMIMDINHRETKGMYALSTVVSTVNEFGVLEEEIEADYTDHPYLDELGIHSEYWLGAVANKKGLKFPSPNEVRVINYESCRGLEAWSVMCMNIDNFYNGQVHSKDAESFLLQEDIYLTKEQRAAMFGITWILMAATRAIDTLYLQMSNKENELYKICQKYALAFPGNCRIIRDEVKSYL
jgi:hypothetical protein